MAGELFWIVKRRRFVGMFESHVASEHSPEPANRRSNRYEVPRTIDDAGFDRFIRIIQVLRRIVLLFGLYR